MEVLQKKIPSRKYDIFFRLEVLAMKGDVVQEVYW